MATMLMLPVVRLQHVHAKHRWQENGKKTASHRTTYMCVRVCVVQHLIFPCDINFQHGCTCHFPNLVTCNTIQMVNCTVRVQYTVWIAALSCDTPGKGVKNILHINRRVVPMVETSTPRCVHVVTLLDRTMFYFQVIYCLRITSHKICNFIAIK